MRPFFIMLAGTAIVASAQQGRIGPWPVPGLTSQPTAKSGTSCGIEGQVQDVITGAPVHRAALVLRRTDTSRMPPSSRRYSTMSDEHGRFALKDVEPGNYRVSVTRVGFVPVEYGAREPFSAGTTLSLNAGRVLEDVVLRLTPHAVLAGRIAGERGDPIPFVQVQALGYRYNRGRKQLTSFGAAATNDLGEYRIFGLPPGRYYLSATHRQNTILEAGPERALSQTSDEDYVPTYYPRGTDPTFATTIEARPGAQLTGVDFVLLKSPAVRIRGRVTKPTGTGMVRVIIAPDDETRVLGTNRTYITDSQGNFEIHGISPGNYTLYASVLSRERLLSAKQKVSITTNVADLVITLSPPIELTGRVRIDGNRTSDLSRLRLSLQPHRTGTLFSALPTARVEGDGKFTLVNVSPDDYYLAAVGLPDGYYVKSAAMGDRDVLDAGISLTPNSAEPITVVLSPGAASVLGIVVNAEGKPAVGATAVLVPQEARRREQVSYYRTITTDQQGRFLLNGLSPSTYKLFAWEQVEFNAWMDKEFLDQFDDRGQTLKISEGTERELQLKLIPADFHGSSGTIK